jgi:hypothetical protein
MSKTLVVILSAFTATVLVFVIIAMVSYQTIVTENKGLKRDLDKARVALVAADEVKDRALVNLMLLETDMRPDKKAKPDKKPYKKKKPASRKKPPVLASQSAVAPASASADANAKSAGSEELRPVEGVSPAQRTDTAEAPAAAVPGMLSVEKLAIWQEPERGSVKFQFSLRNTNPRGIKVRGYTFVALKPKEKAREPVRVSPWTPLKDGKPDIFKRGQYFSIARFKYVRGSFPDLSAIDRFETAVVYVYSETGDLVVEQVYEVDEVLRS